MKKTVILALSLVYLASIIIVQFFGLRVMEMQGTQLVSDIVIHSLELTNRATGQSTNVKLLQTESGDTSIAYYAFTFYDVEDGAYDNSETSLKNNPNRIKIHYEVRPYDAAVKDLRFEFTNENVVFLEETSELVFLKKSGLVLTLRARDASQVAKTLQIIPTIQEI